DGGGFERFGEFAHGEKWLFARKTLAKPRQKRDAPIVGAGPGLLWSALLVEQGFGHDGVGKGGAAGRMDAGRGVDGLWRGRRRCKPADRQLRRGLAERLVARLHERLVLL